MKLFLFSLFLLLPSVATSSYKEFLEICLQKNDNGECDLQCRNFTSVLNNFEESDCGSVETEKYTVTITVDLYPPEVFAYLQKAERLMREAVESQVELASTNEELNDVIDEYRKNVSAYVPKSLWPMNIKFYVFLPICDVGCPQGEDYLQGLLKRPSHALKYRDVRISKPSDSSVCVVTLLIVATVMMIVVLGVVVKINGERRTVNSRKRTIQQVQATWIIPTDVEAPFGKRSRGQAADNRNCERLEVPAPPNIAPPPVSTAVAIEMLPAPPNIPHPPVSTDVAIGMDDIFAHYEEVALLRTNSLHNYVTFLNQNPPDRQRLKYFVNLFGINSQDDDGSTAFVLAVSEGNIHLAEILLSEFGADGNIMDSHHMTALHHAVEAMDLGMLKMIVSRKELVETIIDGFPAIDSLSKSGMTPLVRCATNTTPLSVPMAQILINAGASITVCGDQESANYNGKTVLHYAAQYNNKRLVAFLLEFAEAQSIIDSMDSSERTALWYACSVGATEIVRILLEHRANQFRPDGEKEKQPRAEAEKYGQHQILQLLDEIDGSKFVEAEKKNKKKKKPRQRRSSGYFSGTSAGDCSPPPPALSPSTNYETKFHVLYQPPF